MIDFYLRAAEMPFRLWWDMMLRLGEANAQLYYRASGRY